MSAGGKVQVVLDQTTMEGLLKGLYNGAKNKSLKMLRGVDGLFYVESKELRITLESNAAFTRVNNIRIENDKMYADLTHEILDKMHLSATAADVVREMSEKYNPASHSLADSIYAFAKTYGK